MSAGRALHAACVVCAILAALGGSFPACSDTSSGGSAGPACWSCGVSSQPQRAGMRQVAERWSSRLAGHFTGEMPAGGALGSGPFELDLSPAGEESISYDALAVPDGCQATDAALQTCAGYRLPLVAQLRLSGSPLGRADDLVSVFDGSARCAPEGAEGANAEVNGCPRIVIEYSVEDYGRAVQFVFDELGGVWGAFHEGETSDGGSDTLTRWGERAE